MPRGYLLLGVIFWIAVYCKPTGPSLPLRYHATLPVYRWPGRQLSQPSLLPDLLRTEPPGYLLRPLSVMQSGKDATSTDYPHIGSKLEAIEQLAASTAVENVETWAEMLSLSAPSFSALELLKVFSACAALCGRNAQFLPLLHAHGVLNTLAYEAEKYVAFDGFPFETIPDLLFSMALLQVNNSALLGALADRLLPDLQSMSIPPAVAAKVMWSYAILNHTATPLLVSLARQVAFHPERPAASTIANIVWALATLDIQDEPVLTALVRRVIAQPGTAVRHLCKVAWACGCLRLRSSELMVALADTIVKAGVAVKGSVVDITEMAWAFATLDIHHPALLSAILTRIRQPVFLQSLEGPQLAGLLWSLATLHVSDASAIAALVKQFCRHHSLTDSLTMQQLHQVLWASARLPMRDASLLHAISHQLKSTTMLNQFGVNELCDTFAAMAHMPHASVDEVMWSLLEQRMLSPDLRNRWRGYHICSLLNSLAAIPAPLEAVHKFAAQLLDRVDDRRLVATTVPEDALAALQTLAIIRYQHTRAMHSLAQCALRPTKRNKMVLQSIADTAWSYATLAAPPPPLLYKMIQESVYKSKLEPNWNLRPLATLGWAMAVLDCQDDQLLTALVHRLSSMPLQQTDMCQTHQLIAHILLRAAVLPRATAMVNNMSELQERCQTAFAKQSRLTKRQMAAEQSWLQVSVAAVLKRLHLDTEEESVLPDALYYTVDIWLRGTRTVIEVDGPTHFVHSDTGIHVEGATTLKRRHLMAAGYQVIVVPYFEWKLLDSLEDKLEYIQAALAERT